MSHHVKKCRECKTIISQCRCFDHNKEVIWETCATCAKKILDQATKQSLLVPDKIVDCDSVDPKFIPIQDVSRLTAAEQKVVDMSVDLWNAICALPEVHPMEKREVYDKLPATHESDKKVLEKHQEKKVAKKTFNTLIEDCL